jgi:hypothetical protein
VIAWGDKVLAVVVGDVGCLGNVEIAVGDERV